MLRRAVSPLSSGDVQIGQVRPTEIEAFVLIFKAASGAVVPVVINRTIKSKPIA